MVSVSGHHVHRPRTMLDLCSTTNPSDKMLLIFGKQDPVKFASCVHHFVPVTSSLHIVEMSSAAKHRFQDSRLCLWLLGFFSAAVRCHCPPPFQNVKFQSSVDLMEPWLLLRLGLRVWSPTADYKIPGVVILPRKCDQNACCDWQLLMHVVWVENLLSVLRISSACRRNDFRGG